MTPFIVHANGFVLETTAQLLRDHGARVIEAPCPERAAAHMAESLRAVLVCSKVPPFSSWTRRRVVPLHGVSPSAIDTLVAGGALVTRPERPTLQGLLDAAFRVNARRSAEAPEVPATRAERSLLTRRQLEVVGLIARGLTSQEIAVDLGVRRKTVENYKQRLFTRLGVQNQAHAVARCSRLGLIGERPHQTLAS